MMTKMPDNVIDVVDRKHYEETRAWKKEDKQYPLVDEKFLYFNEGRNFMSIKLTTQRTFVGNFNYK